MGTVPDPVLRAISAVAGPVEQARSKGVRDVSIVQRDLRRQRHGVAVLDEHIAAGQQDLQPCIAVVAFLACLVLRLCHRLGHALQLPPGLPGVGPFAVTGHVADAVVRDRVAVEGNQLVFPGSVVLMLFVFMYQT